MFKSKFKGQEVEDLLDLINLNSTAFGFFYTKPSGGIPSSDMDSAVQNALSKAIAALQTESDPVYQSEKSTLALKTDVTYSMNTHNTNNTAHSDIRQEISDVEAIARGKSRARVFSTVANLDSWLSVPDNVATLQIGDNFYIEDTGVPDYWWSGMTKLPLEAEKVDLTDYYSKPESDNRFVAKVAGKQLSTEDFTTAYKNSLAWENETANVVSSLTNVPITSQKVYANLNANQSLTVNNGTAPAPGHPMLLGKPLHIDVRNTGTTARVITLPNTGSYISLSGTSKELIASGYMEISVTWDTQVSKYRILVSAQ